MSGERDEPHPLLAMLLAACGLRPELPDRVRLGLALAETLVAATGVAAAGLPSLALLVCLPASSIAAALAAGYADQAHMTRELVALGGRTPGAVAA